MAWTHVIVAISPEDSARLKADPAGTVENIGILHACWYEEEPSEDSIQALYLELQSDPEFDLVGREVVLWSPPNDVRDTMIAEGMAPDSDYMRPDASTRTDNVRH